MRINITVPQDAKKKYVRSTYASLDNRQIQPYLITSLFCGHQILNGITTLPPTWQQWYDVIMISQRRQSLGIHKHILLSKFSHDCLNGDQPYWMTVHCSFH